MSLDAALAADLVRCLVLFSIASVIIIIVIIIVAQLEAEGVQTGMAEFRHIANKSFFRIIFSTNRFSQLRTVFHGFNPKRTILPLANSIFDAHGRKTPFFRSANGFSRAGSP